MMKLLAKVVVHLLSICGLVIFLVLPRNKYEWMQEVDPSISVSQIENDSSNGMLFTLLFLIIIIATQVGLVATASSKKEKIASITLTSLAIGFWLLWYWK